MTVRLLRGDCRETLPTLEAGSVQAVCTSPPYFGLRSYGTPDLVWGGDPDHEHEWLHVDEVHNRGDASAGLKQKSNNGAVTGRGVVHYSACPCGAWLGSLGLEPTLDKFIEHLVECFSHVKRVLADTGTCWINLGDSYSGDKNLLMMPSRLAMALHQDGWILRSMIPWLKRAAMPESVTDRPSSAVEYIFLFSKSPRYYWDADAVRTGVSENTHSRGTGIGKKQALIPMGTGNRANENFGSAINGPVSSRNRRNTDWFMESWQGLMLGEDDAPLAMIVNPAGFKGAHFATFPSKLVEPMVKASTSEKGQCPECGAPWTRCVERTPMIVVPSERRATAATAGAGRGSPATSGTMTSAPTSLTTGWQSSCRHSPDLAPVPQIVLDPFAGAGTTLMVADRLGRNAIGCELSSEYSDLGANRLIGDNPMFTELESA